MTINDGSRFVLDLKVYCKTTGDLLLSPTAAKTKSIHLVLKMLNGTTVSILAENE